MTCSALAGGSNAVVVGFRQDLQNQQAKGNLLARRRFQRGTISPRGDKWVAQWREDEIRPGVDTPYRIRRKRVIGDKKDFPTKRLAQRELDRILAEVNNPAYRPAIAITFAEFAEQWQSKVLSQLKPSYQSSERSRLKHQLCFFDAFALRDIQPQTVQTFVSTCKANAKTVRNAVMTLRSMWKSAKAWGYVTMTRLKGCGCQSSKRRNSRFSQPSRCNRSSTPSQTRSDKRCIGWPLRLACAQVNCAVCNGLM